MKKNADCSSDAPDQLTNRWRPGRKEPSLPSRTVLSALTSKCLGKQSFWQDTPPAPPHWAQGHLKAVCSVNCCSHSWPMTARHYATRTPSSSLQIMRLWWVSSTRMTSHQTEGRWNNQRDGCWLTESTKGPRATGHPHLPGGDCEEQQIPLCLPGGEPGPSTPAPPWGKPSRISTSWEGWGEMLYVAFGIVVVVVCCCCLFALKLLEKRYSVALCTVYVAGMTTIPLLNLLKNIIYHALFAYMQIEHWKAGSLFKYLCLQFHY